MLTDREIIRTLTLEHLEGDDYLLCTADQSHVGEDND